MNGINARSLASAGTSRGNILTRGVDVNHQDKDGDAAVHGAALYGNGRILKLLLDGGANPNVKNAIGRHGPNVGRRLRTRGDGKHAAHSRRHPKIRDVDGVTAAGWAAKNSRASIELMCLCGKRS